MAGERMAASQPPEPFRLASGNDRIGARRAVPAVEAECRLCSERRPSPEGATTGEVRRFRSFASRPPIGSSRTQSGLLLTGREIIPAARRSRADQRMMTGDLAAGRDLL